MSGELIEKDAVLNMPLKFTANNKHDAEIVEYVLQQVMNYVKSLKPAEEKAAPKRTRKKT